MITGPTGPTPEQLAARQAAAAEAEQSAEQAAAEQAAAIDAIDDQVWTALADYGLDDPEDIAAADDADLLIIPGIGPATLAAIRKAIG